MSTSDGTTVLEHLHELQSLVQKSLKQWNLSTNTNTATALTGVSNSTRMTNELHPLGPVQVAVLQKEYKEKIAAIRAICYSFAQGPLHQSLNGGDSSLAPAFRKYSTILKDETLLQEGLSAVKASMKQCQNTLRAASQDGAIKTEHLLNTIKEMATGLGLECYLETGSRPNSILPVSTLTIGGTIDVESTGAILRVKIDRLLAHNLRCKCGRLQQSVQEKNKASEAGLMHLPDCSRDFDAFYKNLKALATLDSFSKKYPSIDFFHNMRSMDADLKELFRREMYGANEKIKVPFHRINITMEESLAPSSGYLPAERSRFLLTEEETQTLNSVPYGTIMTDQGSVSATTILQHPLRWVVPKSDPSVEAAYVGILNPPVIVCEEVAKQLAALSNQAGLNATMGLNKDQGYLSLQEYLIGKDVEQTQWVIVLDQGPNAIRQLYSFDRTKTEARLIHRIPFTHISQVYMCTKLFRSQLTFNALFQSCFNETQIADGNTKRSATVLPGSESLSEVSIVIHTPQPPKTILVSFQNPYTETDMVLEIQIDAGTGQPSVQIITKSTGGASGNYTAAMNEAVSTGNLHQQQQQQHDPLHPNGANSSEQDASLNFDAQTLTKVLRLSDNIPVLVRWVLRKSLAWMKDRYHYQHNISSGHGHADEGGILKKSRV
ncbi:hypothetical protein BGZ94_002500 [Podila epigama]|nr:hypothetical protein BGZ94_002500 [Podila epigama]